MGENIKIDLKKKKVGKVWTGFIWLGIGTSGKLMNTVINLQNP
jgi:hypothetical protein